jgi:hypothetical protein
MKSWKSTASGILSFVMATAGTLTAFAAAQVAVNPAQSKVYAYITAGCTLASGLAKAWIGLLTKDADTVTATDVAKATIASNANEVKPNA